MVAAASNFYQIFIILAVFATELVVSGNFTAAGSMRTLLVLFVCHKSPSFLNED
jgi:hypothetical protein